MHVSIWLKVSIDIVKSTCLHCQWGWILRVWKCSGCDVLLYWTEDKVSTSLAFISSGNAYLPLFGMKWNMAPCRLLRSRMSLHPDSGHDVYPQNCNWLSYHTFQWWVVTVQKFCTIEPNNRTALHHSAIYQILLESVPLKYKLLKIG